MAKYLVAKYLVAKYLVAKYLVAKYLVAKYEVLVKIDVEDRFCEQFHSILILGAGQDTYFA